jgi:hypothetical protein
VLASLPATLKISTPPTFASVPYAGSQTKLEDSFNYELSSLRIEEVFGIVGGRFAVLWSPMRCTLVEADRIVVVCCKIHNFIFEKQGRREGADIDHSAGVARTGTVTSSARHTCFHWTNRTANSRNRKSRATSGNGTGPCETVWSTFSSWAVRSARPTDADLYNRRSGDGTHRLRSACGS